MLLAAGVSLAALTGCGHSSPAKPVVTTFTHKAGRVCTEVVTAKHVALDCAFPPIEQRADSLLRQLGERLAEAASPTTSPTPTQ